MKPEKSIEEKAKELYPIILDPNGFQTGTSNPKTVATIQQIAYAKGYSDCKKEYDEKLRFIPVEELLPIQEQSDYQIAVVIRDSNYCPHDIVTIPYNGIDFDFGRFSRLYSKWRRF